MQLFVFSILAAQAVALYITATSEHPLVTSPTTATIETNRPNVVGTVTSTISLPPTMTFSSLITIAPLSRNPLELRQRCFNDQGFSVDCAVWTGYYYTWGGAGHPYAGGPGDDSGSNARVANINGAVIGTMGSTTPLERLWWAGLTALLTLCLLVML